MGAPIRWYPNDGMDRRGAEAAKPGAAPSVTPSPNYVEGESCSHSSAWAWKASQSRSARIRVWPATSTYASSASPRKLARAFLGELAENSHRGFPGASVLLDHVVDRHPTQQILLCLVEASVEVRPGHDRSLPISVRQLRRHALKALLARSVPQFIRAFTSRTEAGCG